MGEWRNLAYFITRWPAGHGQRCGPGNDHQLERKLLFPGTKKKTSKIRLTLPDSWSIRAHVFEEDYGDQPIGDVATFLVDEIIWNAHISHTTLANKLWEGGFANNKRSAEPNLEQPLVWQQTLLLLVRRILACLLAFLFCLVWFHPGSVHPSLSCLFFPFFICSLTPPTPLPRERVFSALPPALIRVEGYTHLPLSWLLVTGLIGGWDF